MSKKKQRSRNISLISYLPSTAEVLERIAQKLDLVRYYATIYHDKDIDESGQPKPPHHHIALILKTNRYIDQIRKWFESVESDGETPINCLAQATISNSAIIDYFTHKNEPTKYQYSADEIASNDITAFEDETAEDNTICIIDDLIQERSLREMVKLYGRDFVFHYTQYESIANKIKSQDKN